MIKAFIFAKAESRNNLQAVRHKASNEGGDQTDFRQSTELLGRGQREHDYGTQILDGQRLPDGDTC